MKPLLRVAGIYNLLWGMAVILLPSPTMRLAGFDPEHAYPEMWQCIGMIVGVYGIGYWCAARNAYRHWPVVLVGFLGKTFGPIGAVQGIVTGKLPVSILWTNLFNDLIWWVPFALILLGAWRAAQNRDAAAVKDDPSIIRERFASLVADGRTLVVFLRHSGCTFCREAIADLDAAGVDLASRDVRVLLIPPGPTDRDKLLAGTSHLSDAVVLADPANVLASDHALQQGGFGELFGTKVWGPGARACLIDGHGVGMLDGNGFQLPGLFLYDDGDQVAAYRHATAHDRPNYVAFASGEAAAQPVGAAG